ncbi:MAG: ankyrin repeat domain-containing protein, partial [Draconibacterium sp.]|nr:ankyrin repeat domain-containing protein [Draconibacterium sp.]
MKALKSILVFAVLLLIAVSSRGQDIFDAIRNGDLTKVKELVEKDPQLVAARNARQSTPLHIAAVYDNAEIAKYLIEKGSDVNIQNGNFYSPLMFAGIKVAKLLVEKGADLNYISQYGGSAIAESLERGRINVAEYLLDKGVIIPDINTKQGKDMLFAALRIGSVKYLDKCLLIGLDPMLESDSKSNLIHFAAESNSIELINRLIELGVLVNKANLYGWTPLHAAANSGNKSVVELFIQKRLDRNARTIDGKTPYNLAAENKMTDVVNYLDSIGADKDPQKFPILRNAYFGQKKPGSIAKPFALPMLANRHNYAVRSITFTPDGKEAYWPIIDRQDGYTRWIVGSRIEKGVWTIPQIAPFSKKGFEDDVPCITPNGKHLLFISGRPIEPDNKTYKENIWIMNRVGDHWSDPVPLPETINSLTNIHQQLSVDIYGNLYFSCESPGGLGSLDIYMSKYVNGEFTQPVNLGQVINGTEGEYAPFISPDASYLIFTRNIQNGWTLYISFREQEDGWTTPIDISGNFKGLNKMNVSG